MMSFFKRFYRLFSSASNNGDDSLDVYAIIEKSKKFNDADEKIIDHLMRTNEKIAESAIQSKHLISSKCLQLLIFLATGEAGILGYIVLDISPKSKNALFVLAIGIIWILLFLLDGVIAYTIDSPYLTVSFWEKEDDIVTIKRLQLVYFREKANKVSDETRRITVRFIFSLLASLILALIALSFYVLKI